LESTHSDDIKPEIVQQTTDDLEKKKESIQISAEPVVGGLFSCFGNKKAKASTEQQGPSTVAPPSTSATAQTTVSQTTKSVQEKPSIDYAILPDGKRIYIDSYRERPGLDMSYKPNEFDTRFVLPVVRIH
jgi:hypothetical protein